MDIMRYRTIMFNDSLLILLSQFVAIPEKAFWASFCKEKQSDILHSRFYQRLTLNTKKSDTCRCNFDHNLVPTILGAISTHNVHFMGKRLSSHPETIYIIILHGDMKSAFRQPNFHMTLMNIKCKILAGKIQRMWQRVCTKYKR